MPSPRPGVPILGLGNILLLVMPGVRPPGVLVHFPDGCAGLGVMLRNSENSQFLSGVCGAPKLGIPPPGVVINVDGSARARDGGVEGGCMLREF